MQALENCWGVLRASFEFKLLYTLILLPSSNEVNKPKIFIQGQCKILFEPRIFNKRELDFQKIVRSFRARNYIFGDFCDDGICTCTVNTLILLMVVNISKNMDSATSIPYDVKNFSRPTLFFIYFGNFSLTMHSFDRTTTSGLKSDVIFEFSASVSL